MKCIMAVVCVAVFGSFANKPFALDGHSAVLWRSSPQVSDPPA